jgi:mRNA-degrading endonuclease toxin of MazEF toxin-antitoxin module
MKDFLAIASALATPTYCSAVQRPHPRIIATPKRGHRTTKIVAIGKGLRTWSGSHIIVMIVAVAAGANHGRARSSLPLHSIKSLSIAMAASAMRRVHLPTCHSSAIVVGLYCNVSLIIASPSYQ